MKLWERSRALHETGYAVPSLVLERTSCRLPGEIVAEIVVCPLEVQFDQLIVTIHVMVFGEVEAGQGLLEGVTALNMLQDGSQKVTEELAELVNLLRSLTGP